MAEKNPNEVKADKAGSTGPEELGAATRHVGRTLEAEGIFADVRGTHFPPFASTARGGSLGDERIDSLEVRTFGEDQSEQQKAALEDDRLSRGVTEDAVSADSDTASQNFPGNLESRPEALKTRLPGDTSSDPHTDVTRTDASKDEAA